MTNVTAHAAPITEQEAHSIGVDAYREMHFLGKYDSPISLFARSR
jgi:hypothetical protein